MSRAAGAWERFWFVPEPTSTLGVVRIAFGLVTLAWAVALLPVLDHQFTSAGVLPGEAASESLEPGAWSVLILFGGDAFVWGLYGLLVAGAICVTIGYRTRLAAVLVFVALMSFERRNPLVFNAGDGLLRIMALYVMLAPSGASLSLDRWRRARARFWEFPARAAWPLRLMQVQLSIVYLTAVWAKVQGPSWNDGTAVPRALRVEDLQRLPVPEALLDSPLPGNALTYGTLAAELAIAILVWNRAARPYVLALGVGLHLGIDYALRVGFFSYSVLLLYLAFIPPETAREKLLALRDRLARRPERSGTAASPAAEAGSDGRAPSGAALDVRRATGRPSPPEPRRAWPGACRRPPPARAAGEPRT